MKSATDPGFHPGIPARIILIPFLLFICFGCRATYTIRPEYEWEYPRELWEMKKTGVDDMDRVVAICRETVEEAFGIDPIQVEVHQTSETLQARVVLEEGVFKTTLFVEDSRVFLEHLEMFCGTLAHEITEMLLSCEAYRRGALYRSDPVNRWIGEGIAEYMSRQALLRAIEEGIPFLEGYYLRLAYLDKAKADRVNTVRLAGWPIRVAGESTADRHTLLQHLRYACAEYLIDRWVAAAREKGTAWPLRSFWQWLMENPGPRYEDAGRWMEEVSGLPLRRMAEAVPLSEVKDYTMRVSNPKAVPNRLSIVE